MCGACPAEFRCKQISQGEESHIIIFALGKPSALFHMYKHHNKKLSYTFDTFEFLLICLSPVLSHPKCLGASALLKS